MPTFEEFTKSVLKNESQEFNAIQPGVERLLHAGIGMATEAGEFLDSLKKHLYYGKPLDGTNLLEEIGDCLWYVALGIHVLDSSLEEVLTRNMEKLAARYSKGFSSEEALNRNLDLERKILETAAPRKVRLAEISFDRLHNRPFKKVMVKCDCEGFLPIITTFEEYSWDLPKKLHCAKCGYSASWEEIVSDWPRPIVPPVEK